MLFNFIRKRCSEPKYPTTIPVYMLFNFIRKRSSEPKYPTTIPLVRQWAQNTCMVARVNKELCLTKAIHFVKVLCREFVHGNLFSWSTGCLDAFLQITVKVSGGPELAQSEKKDHCS